MPLKKRIAFNMTSNLVDYRNNIHMISVFLTKVGLSFHPKGYKFSRFAVCLFQCIWMSALMFHSIGWSNTDRFVKLKQTWGVIIMSQTPIKSINWIFHKHLIQRLLEWYESIYTNKLNEDYQELLDKRLAKQNLQIKYGIWFFKITSYVAIGVYMSEPFIGSGDLPTPVYLNGVPDRDLPWHIFYCFYGFYLLNSIIVVCLIVSIESFYVLCTIMLGHRFGFIADILGLLNYEGVRDRAKDKRIITDAHLMHLEVFE